MKVSKTIMVAIAALTVAGSVTQGAEKDPLIAQDPVVLRFVERAIPYYPDSSFTVVADDRKQTPSGSYRIVRVSRTCENRILTGEPSVVIDEVTGIAYLGSVGELPFEQTGTSPRSLRPFLEGFLPDVLQRNLNMKIRVSWDAPEGSISGAITPFSLIVDTGYGEFARPAAVTSDGNYLIMGTGMPLDGDPVAIRRELFDASDFVLWDHAGEDGAPVEIVEFSDLECPACKGKWPMVKQVIEANSGSIRHGMVSFPLTSIHPWAFRASSATWCIGEQGRELVIPFKELFYDLQREMAVTEVTPTSMDFVVGHDLDEAAFRACYLRAPSLQAVHSQLALGNLVGVNATPTYFVNGWMIQMPAEDWFPKFISLLAEGREP